MEKIIETCLICGEYMGTFKNEMTVPTGFSERPIYQMFGELNLWGGKLRIF